MAPLTLVLGGARSGKSSHARSALEHREAVTYLATAEPTDTETQRRIRDHQDKRPDSWSTREPPYDLPELARSLGPNRTVLLDDLALWVAGQLEDNQPESIQERTETVADTIQSNDTPWVIVSARVGLGVVPDSVAGRRFRDAQGWANQTLAEAADGVVEVTAGIPSVLSGTPFSSDAT